MNNKENYQNDLNRSFCLDAYLFMSTNTNGKIRVSLNKKKI